jgi:hypothetical protein
LTNLPYRIRNKREDCVTVTNNAATGAGDGAAFSSAVWSIPA